MCTLRVVFTVLFTPLVFFGVEEGTAEEVNVLPLLWCEERGVEEEESLLELARSAECIGGSAGRLIAS